MNFSIVNGDYKKGLLFQFNFGSLVNGPEAKQFPNLVSEVGIIALITLAFGCPLDKVPVYFAFPGFRLSSRRVEDDGF